MQQTLDYAESELSRYKSKIKAKKEEMRRKLRELEALGEEEESKRPGPSRYHGAAAM